MEVQKGGEGGQFLSWRAAVLRAGTEELACDNPQNKELYLALAIVPKAVEIELEDVAVLLNGGNKSTEDLRMAGRVAATLERWSILIREADGGYIVHDEHRAFVRERFASNRDVQDRVLPSLREHISGAHVLLNRSSATLVRIWDEFLCFKSTMVCPRPYDAALDAMDPSSCEGFGALLAAANFHTTRQDWGEASAKYSKLLMIEHNAVYDERLNVQGNAVGVDRVEV